MLIADTGPLVTMLNAKDQPPRGMHCTVPAVPQPVIGPIVTGVSYFL